MRKLFLLLMIAAPVCAAQAQFGPAADSSGTAPSDWNNYSTSYLGDISDSTPLLVTAIPYNGIHDYGNGGPANTPLDLSFDAYRFRSQLGDSSQLLYTYDSGLVYFLAPGIFRANAAGYEFRVLEDGRKEVKPWGPVTGFVEQGFRLGAFRPGFGLLGGFATKFGHYLVVELRRHGAVKPFTASMVRWQAARPALAAVLTTGDLTARMLSVTNDYRPDPDMTRLLQEQYGSASNAAGRGIPAHWEVPPGQNGLIFQVGARIYQKGVLEYRFLRDGREILGWTGNKANNSYIWIDHPAPGHYTLEMRYRRHPSGVSSYPFTVAPAWYQAWWFKVGGGILIGAFVALPLSLLSLRRQRRRVRAEQEKKERLELGLRSVYAQLNPHFTFNALSSIQGLINNRDIEGANHYLSEFALLVRRSLADSEKKFIPLQQELDTLDTYLGLEKLRFNFGYTIHCAEGFPVSQVEIPSLLLQPLVENAVKHGVAVLQEKGVIAVEVQGEAGDMLISIEDNGAGFDAASVKEGYGLALTRSRMRLFNEMAGTDQLSMRIDSRPGGGTVITLLFKNWLA